jgi:heat shock protein HslJ
MLHFLLSRGWLSILTMIVYWLLASCTLITFDSSTPTPLVVTPVQSEPNSLDNTRWDLVAIENFEFTSSLPDQPQLFVEFKNGELALQGGCNDIYGYYLIDNNHLRITFAEGTLMNCPDLQEIMKVEEKFLNAMPTFESYTITDDELVIHYAEGQIRLRRVSD